MKGYHILLGEDEPDILEYNREQLEQRGYQVTAVSTLGQAEACVLRDNPDLLVLDVMMPDGSGLELCRRLREQFQGPILFLTSLGESSQIVQGLRVGGDDYITKPYDIEELAARIEAHLRRLERRVGEDIHQGGSRLYLNVKSQRAYLDAFKAKGVPSLGRVDEKQGKIYGGRGALQGDMGYGAQPGYTDSLGPYI